MPRYMIGQTVVYKPVGGPESDTPESQGLIRSIMTTPGKIADLNVEASQEEPTYEIENENTHKTSPIKEPNIIGPSMVNRPGD